MTDHAPAGSTPFNPTFPYAPGTTERSVEIPWSLARYGGGARILEVGCSFAYENPDYIARLKALNVLELHGIDISSEAAPDFIKRTADIRESGYPSDYFDTVFCISTLEHVGRDNARHYKPVAELPTGIDSEPDFAAVTEMLRILKPAGQLIITVPFGKRVDYGWFQTYDIADVRRVFRTATLSE